MLNNTRSENCKAIKQIIAGASSVTFIFTRAKELRGSVPGRASKRCHLVPWIKGELSAENQSPNFSSSVGVS